MSSSTFNAGRLSALFLVLLAFVVGTVTYLRFDSLLAYAAEQRDADITFRAHGPLRARQLARPELYPINPPFASNNKQDVAEYLMGLGDPAEVEPREEEEEEVETVTVRFVPRSGNPFDAEDDWLSARSEPEPEPVPIYADANNDWLDRRDLMMVMEAAEALAQEEETNRVPARALGKRNLRSRRRSSPYSNSKRLYAREPEEDPAPTSTTSATPSSTPTSTQGGKPVNEVVNDFWSADSLWDNKGAIAGVLVITGLMAIGLFEVAYLLIRKYYRERNDPSIRENEARAANRESIFGSDSNDDKTYNILMPPPNAYFSSETAVALPRLARNSTVSIEGDFDKAARIAKENDPRFQVHAVNNDAPPLSLNPYDGYADVELAGDHGTQAALSVPAEQTRQASRDLALQRLKGVTDEDLEARPSYGHESVYSMYGHGAPKY
ncbi:hypothetical protein HGRIS_009399 [Hohenbuehelia grisea]|uniref:Uncharacterized protein n=1 Tax=Hohenbuehelia grisea TaxID=104357 RepID=A0ABR3J123_9AGAR